MRETVTISPCWDVIGKGRIQIRHLKRIKGDYDPLGWWKLVFRKTPRQAQQVDKRQRAAPEEQDLVQSAVFLEVEDATSGPGEQGDVERKTEGQELGPESERQPKVEPEVAVVESGN